MRLDGFVVAFDLDGTLVDTAPDLIGSLNAVLAEQHLPALPMAAARHLVGRGARSLLERGFADAGRTLSDAEAAPLTRRFIDIYRGRIADESRAFDGVAPALDALAAAGARLAVCTNKPQALSDALLAALGLADRFAAVVGADSVPVKKPDAGHLRAAVERAGGRLPHALLVGDSETDVLTARAAGVPVVLVPFGYTEIPAAQLGADRLIQSFDEVAAVVAQLARPPQGGGVHAPA